MGKYYINTGGNEYKTYERAFFFSIEFAKKDALTKIILYIPTQMDVEVFRRIFDKKL